MYAGWWSWEASWGENLWAFLDASSSWLVDSASAPYSGDPGRGVQGGAWFQNWNELPLGGAKIRGPHPPRPPVFVAEGAEGWLSCRRAKGSDFQSLSVDVKSTQIPNMLSEIFVCSSDTPAGRVPSSMELRREGRVAEPEAEAARAECAISLQ